MAADQGAACPRGCVDTDGCGCEWNAPNEGVAATGWYDPPEGRVSKMAGRLQGWLHRRRWPLWLVGNLISSVRYWSWRRQGGTHGC